MAEIDLTCDYVMQNATKGVAECNTDFTVDLLPLQIAVVFILLFVAWRVWVGYKIKVRPLIFDSNRSEKNGN